MCIEHRGFFLATQAAGIRGRPGTGKCCAAGANSAIWWQSPTLMLSRPVHNTGSAGRLVPVYQDVDVAEKNWQRETPGAVSRSAGS